MGYEREIEFVWYDDNDNEMLTIFEVEIFDDAGYWGTPEQSREPSFEVVILGYSGDEPNDKVEEKFIEWVANNYGD